MGKPTFLELHLSLCFFHCINSVISNTIYRYSPTSETLIPNLELDYNGLKNHGPKTTEKKYLESRGSTSEPLARKRVQSTYKEYNTYPTMGSFI